VLNVLEPINLNIWKVAIQRLTVPVVNVSMDNGVGNAAGCFEINI